MVSQRGDSIGSRGHGRIERALLAALDAAGDHLDPFELTARVFHPDQTGSVIVSDAQLAAMWRALGKLADEGLVVSETQPGRKRVQWISRATPP